MRVLFPILASLVAILLAAGYYAGLVGRTDSIGWEVRLGSVALALAIHGWSFAFLWLTWRRIEAIVRREGLPEWLGARAEKNRRKAWLFQVSGSMLVVLGVGSLLFEYWQPILDASSVSFQVGAFLNEWLMIENQSRLLAEVRGWTKPDGSVVES